MNSEHHHAANRALAEPDEEHPWILWVRRNFQGTTLGQLETMIRRAMAQGLFSELTPLPAELKPGDTVHIDGVPHLVKSVEGNRLVIQVRQHPPGSCCSADLAACKQAEEIFNDPPGRTRRQEWQSAQRKHRRTIPMYSTQSPRRAHTHRNHKR